MATGPEVPPCVKQIHPELRLGASDPDREQPRSQTSRSSRTCGERKLQISATETGTGTTGEGRRGAAVADGFRRAPGVRETPGKGGGTKRGAEGSSQDVLLPHGAGAD